MSIKMFCQGVFVGSDCCSKYVKKHYRRGPYRNRPLCYRMKLFFVEPETVAMLLLINAPDSIYKTVILSW